MNTDTIPQWDLADRMRKSLRDSGVGVQEMADYLEVGRNTVSTWINGHNPPSGAILRLWAMRCGVPLEWLRHGIEDGNRPITDGWTSGSDGRVVPLLAAA